MRRSQAFVYGLGAGFAATSLLAVALQGTQGEHLTVGLGILVGCVVCLGVTWLLGRRPPSDAGPTP